MATSVQITLIVCITLIVLSKLGIKGIQGKHVDK